MVIPLALGIGAALSPLQGLGFGFGYGYGVRLGYNSYKPSNSKQTNAMAKSLNPIESSVGQGLFAAEERTGIAISDPTVSESPNTTATVASPSPEVNYPNNTLIHSPYENIGVRPKRQTEFKSIDELRAFRQGTDPESQRMYKAYLNKNRFNQKRYNARSSRYR